MGAEPSVLFVNQHYWPDVASTGQQLTDLAEHLAASGFDVSVICGRADYRGGELQAPVREVRRGVKIVRVRLSGFGRRGDSQTGRAVDYAAFHVRAALALLIGDRPDFVVSLTTPSLLPATIRAVCGIRGIDYGVWSMDLHPDVEDRLGLLPGGAVAAAPLYAVSRWGLHGAQFVVALGPCMASVIREKKDVSASRIRVIPTWSDSRNVRPLRKKDNSLRRELGYRAQDFVVLYAGNAGLAHDFGVTLDAMELLQSEADIHFLFVGGGPRRAWIEREVVRRRFDRCRYLDYFPREDLARVLSAGDIHLITLRTDMAGLVAPSKLYGSMAAGRPVVLVGPSTSDPASVILGESVGVVVDPANCRAAAGQLAEAILALRDDREIRDQLAHRSRQAFLERYDRSVGCSLWVELLGGAVH